MILIVVHRLLRIRVRRMGQANTCVAVRCTSSKLLFMPIPIRDKVNQFIAFKDQQFFQITFMSLSTFA